MIKEYFHLRDYIHEFSGHEIKHIGGSFFIITKESTFLLYKLLNMIINITHSSLQSEP